MFFVDVLPGQHASTIPNWLYPGESALTFQMGASQTVYIQTWVGGSGFVGRVNQALRSPEEALGALADLSMMPPEQ
jgi:hypothetical protein